MIVIRFPQEDIPKEFHGINMHDKYVHLELIFSFEKASNHGVLTYENFDIWTKL